MTAEPYSEPMSDSSGAAETGLAEPTLSATARSRYWSFALDRPVLTVFVLALATRLLVAGVVNVVNFRIPDEKQYIDLAATVSSGRPADAWLPGYGQALYDSTRAFTGLLAALYHLTGTSRFTGQVLAAVAGSLTAALTSRLLRGVGPASVGLFAGLVVALMPSQVLWSSVVLRESFVWCAATAIAVAVAVAARSERRRSLWGCLAVAAAALLALGQLRDQTMFILAYAMAVSPWLYRPARHRWGQRAAALILAIVVPVLGGIGIAGYDLVHHAPRLASERSTLSIGADSAITAPDASEPTPRGKDPAVQPPGVTIENEGAVAQLSYLPTGLVAVAARPFPWEPSANIAMLFARVEDFLWLGLYVLALAGLPSAWRHRRVMTFPTVALGGLLLSSALTQGNLGTAFRHRSQILWAVAALAALGLLDVIRRVSERRATLT